MTIELWVSIYVTTMVILFSLFMTCVFVLVLLDNNDRRKYKIKKNCIESVKEPLLNKARRILFSMLPFGLVVWYFRKYGKGDDSLNGTEGWTRVWSSWSTPKGAVVLIRKKHL